MIEIIRAIEQNKSELIYHNLTLEILLKYHVKIKEGNRERVQMFEGTVIKRQNGGIKRNIYCKKSCLWYWS